MQKIIKFIFILLFSIVFYAVHLCNYCHFWGHKENSVISFLVSTVFVVLALFIKRKTNSLFITREQHWIPVFMLGVGASLYYLKRIIAPFPMDKTHSDVIPQMQILAQRFLGGEFPYQPIQFDSYVLFPTYLPLQWIPYTIAELLKIDYRVFALLVLGITILFFLSRIKNLFEFYTYSLLTFSILIIGLRVGDGNYYNCLENMMAAYYMAFAASLIYTKKIGFQVLLLSFCLFSRYSIVLWVPIYFLYLYLNNGFKTTLWAGIGLLSIFIIVYFLPFLAKDPTIFSKGYAYHTAAAAGEWTPQKPNSIPYHLGNGLGFAVFFYDRPDNIQSRIAIFQKIHLLLSILTVGIAVIVGTWRLKKKQIQPTPFFLLWTLALYLTVFYHFIQIPYHYLFVVPFFVYLVLLKATLSPIEQT